MLHKFAHKYAAKERTADVEMDMNISFSKMLLSDNVCSGLKKCGYQNPSPIQIKSIPLGLNGMDLIIQSKSGTGKTLVFGITILEAFVRDIDAPQSLVIAPTREIAVQIECVLSAIGCTTPGFRVGSFIGGIDVKNDRKKIHNCKAIIGTPGRVVHLIKNNILNVNEIKILVLDEADKLLQSSFLTDVNKIYKALNCRKQMIVASATYDNNLKTILASYMKNPVNVSPNKEAPILLGVKQFIYETRTEQNNVRDMFTKGNEIKKIFQTVNFKQCLVFSNSQSRAESFCNYLTEGGWKSEVINGAQDQTTRLDVLRKLKEFKCRILFSTDLMARGIDVENVNLIINIEVPNDPATYLHRIGRAGRFGSHGIAITFLNSDEEKIKFRRLLGAIGGAEMSVLNFPIGKSSDIWNFENRDKEKLEYGEIFGLIEEENEAPALKKSDKKNSKKSNSKKAKKSKNGVPMDNDEDDDDYDNSDFEFDMETQLQREEFLRRTNQLYVPPTDNSNEYVNVFKNYRAGILKNGKNSFKPKLLITSVTPTTISGIGPLNLEDIKSLLANLKLPETIPKEEDTKETIPKKEDKKETIPKEEDTKETILKEEDSKEIIPQEDDRKEKIPEEEDTKQINPKEPKNEVRTEVVESEEHEEEADDEEEDDVDDDDDDDEEVEEEEENDVEEDDEEEDCLGEEDDEDTKDEIVAGDIVEDKGKEENKENDKEIKLDEIVHSEIEDVSVIKGNPKDNTSFSSSPKQKGSSIESKSEDENQQDKIEVIPGPSLKWVPAENKVYNTDLASSSSNESGPSEPYTAEDNVYSFPLDSSSEIEEGSSIETKSQDKDQQEKIEMISGPPENKVYNIDSTSSSSLCSSSSTEEESSTRSESNKKYNSQMPNNRNRFITAQELWNHQYTQQLNTIQNHIQLCRNLREQGYY